MSEIINSIGTLSPPQKAKAIPEGEKLILSAEIIERDSKRKLTKKIVRVAAYSARIERNN
jgi:hypothetical protein